ncbi:MAG: hypothetical protein ACKO4W_05065, partial [Bacteroidota bacterium]
ELEKELMPEFNTIIDPAIQKADGFLDMTTENSLYQFTDGNHLWKESGKLVSLRVAEWVSSCLNKTQN